MPEGGQTRHGQEYDPETNTIKSYTEREVNWLANVNNERTTGLEGTLGRDQDSGDANSAKVRDWDLAGIQADLTSPDATVVLHTNIDDIRFPDVLTGITGVFSYDNGAGSESMPAANNTGVIFGPAQFSIDPSAQSQGSAAVTADISPSIVQFPGKNVPARVVLLYVLDNASRATIKAAVEVALGITTGQLLEWPNFKTAFYNFTLVSARITVEARAQTRTFVGGTTDNGAAGNSYGGGISYDVDIQQRSVRIGPVINGAITVSPTTHSISASADADASTSSLAGELTQGAISNSFSQSKNAVASISPTTLSATSVTTIPSSGQCIYKLDPIGNKYGCTAYRVTVVDMSYFA